MDTIKDQEHEHGGICITVFTKAGTVFASEECCACAAMGVQIIPPEPGSYTTMLAIPTSIH